MRALWSGEDLPRLRLVTSGEAGASIGAGRAASPGASSLTAGSPSHRGARLTEAQVADLEHLAKLLARGRDALNDLEDACRSTDYMDALEAARLFQHVGLLAGDRSRQMEKSL